MKTLLIVVLVVVALIALPVVVIIGYFAFTLLANDTEASHFADGALGQISAKLDTRTFLDYAGSPYTVSLSRYLPAAEAQGSSRVAVVMAGSTPDGVMQTFAKAKSQLGALTKPGHATCRKTLGVVLCFGIYSYQRGSALLFATLQKDDAGYQIRDLRISPVTPPS